MEAINITLSRNHVEQDWSVEIDEILHEHISAKTLDDLIDYAFVAAQQNLLESEANIDGCETGFVSAPSD